MGIFYIFIASSCPYLCNYPWNYMYHIAYLHNNKFVSHVNSQSCCAWIYDPEIHIDRIVIFDR